MKSLLAGLECACVLPSYYEGIPGRTGTAHWGCCVIGIISAFCDVPFSCAEYRGQGTSVAEKCEAICAVMDCNAVIIMLLEAAPPACERVMWFCGITSDVKLCGQKKIKNLPGKKAPFIASNCSCAEADEWFQVSHWRFLVAGGQCFSKSSLQPEDGCLDEVHKHTSLHLPALSITPLLRVQSYTNSQRKEKKKCHF